MIRLDSSSSRPLASRIPESGDVLGSSALMPAPAAWGRDAPDEAPSSPTATLLEAGRGLSGAPRSERPAGRLTTVRFLPGRGGRARELRTIVPPSRAAVKETFARGPLHRGFVASKGPRVEGCARTREGFDSSDREPTDHAQLPRRQLRRRRGRQDGRCRRPGHRRGPRHRARVGTRGRRCRIPRRSPGLPTVAGHHAVRPPSGRRAAAEDCLFAGPVARRPV